MPDRFAMVVPDHFERRRWIAAMICWRFRSIRAQEGTAVAAMRLRKYGFPLELALRVLGIAPSCSVPALGRNTTRGIPAR